jgi:hypothetical protein
LELVDAAAVGGQGRCSSPARRVLASLGSQRRSSPGLMPSVPRVLSCRCYELESTVAYQPLRDAFRQLGADADAAAMRRHTVYVKRLVGAVASTPVADPVLLVGAGR